jgi:hypothetical protein
MSQAEKLALMKVLANSLAENSVAKRKRTLKHLYGALRPKTGRLPSNKQIRKEYVNYLIEKYK